MKASVNYSVDKTRLMQWINIVTMHVMLGENRFLISGYFFFLILLHSF
ncbi:hypothetical protein SAMN06265379_102311 [Saccharicrinis carchari]|uniref:Uncharacterized protein n=1 Tax=Saccharicrinis carchari TaxID=1168039 RepID=A0A521C1B8_SACCC|nr:hypothetical protein SAMN06265379_102311 [Saccharicrinis carchari]